MLIGNWKSYQELEDNISIAELMAVLSAGRDRQHQDRKFMASLKGINLDDAGGEDKWEALKAKVASGGKAVNSKDVMALQGKNAKAKGFGIGLGLDAEVIDSSGNVTKLG